MTRSHGPGGRVGTRDAPGATGTTGTPGGAVGRGVRLWPLYAGGFLGPFAGAMTGVMLPELARALDTTATGAALAVSWFMVPFAAAMLVSGTVAGRRPPSVVVRVAFLAYAASSLVYVAAAGLAPFLVGRALQGVSNAFTTPLLITMIAALVDPGRRGRALGIFASAQAAGTAFAPLMGGAAAAVDYRLAVEMPPTLAAVPAGGR